MSLQHHMHALPVDSAEVSADPTTAASATTRPGYALSSSRDRSWKSAVPGTITTQVWNTHPNSFKISQEFGVRCKVRPVSVLPQTTRASQSLKVPSSQNPLTVDFRFAAGCCVSWPLSRSVEQLTKQVVKSMHGKSPATQCQQLTKS